MKTDNGWNSCQTSKMETFRESILARAFWQNI